MKDLSDIAIQQGMAKCTNYQMRIIIRAEITKTIHQYFIYATKNSTARIVSYLNVRLVKGESLHSDALVIAQSLVNYRQRSNNVNNLCLTTHEVTSRVRELFRPRFSLRPYVLRAYFDTSIDRRIKGKNCT